MTTPDARFKDELLRDAPRLGPADTFRFTCAPERACFGRCCADVNIVLTPYDVLRLKRRLGLESTEFLSRHTLMPFTKEQPLPAVLLRMNADAEKSCPFREASGACAVYSDRPWACRMYPIGQATPSDAAAAAGAAPFYFRLREKTCLGEADGRDWTILDWKTGQGAAEYEAASEPFRRLVLHEKLLSGGALLPQQIELFFMGCYDLDRFRRFLFESSFLRRFAVEPELVERLRADDEALLGFACRWLGFALFGEPTLELQPQELAAQRAKWSGERK